MNTKTNTKSAKSLKPKSTLNLISLIVTATLFVGCATNSVVSKTGLNNYQPDYLLLKVGQKIELADGSIYTVQQDNERFWSDKQYRLATEESINKGYEK